MNDTLIVGDVHGCATELAALVAQVPAARIWLIGDLFARGPDAEGVWEQVCALGARAVLGNHDARALRRPKASGLPPAALDWLAAQPLMHAEDGWQLVHAGVDPRRGPAGTSRHQALHLRRYPDDTDEANPYWWELWQGPPLVIYGHDARRRLVDRRPHSLGLDGGCVYGGALHGYLVQADRILTEPARDSYWRPRTPSERSLP